MFGKHYPNCVKKKLKGKSIQTGVNSTILRKKYIPGTLVRQGVKVGGKKGGKAVQKSILTTTAR